MANAKDWKEKLAAAEQSGKVLESKGFFKFTDLGDHITGKLLGIRPAGDNAKAKSDIAEIQTRNGDTYAVGVSGNLPTVLNESLVDHVISIWYIDTQDVQQPSPMKVYRLIDYGNNWPAED